ncbi:MAG: hypothetical protein NVS3B26_21010 [Mycobacteriales bacterium]
MDDSPTDLRDAGRLRRQVHATYQRLASDPAGPHPFHTGRPLAARLGYPARVVDPLPDAVLEAFAGVANPFLLRTIAPGERVVDVGSGAGLDSFVAASYVGPRGRVVGVDMTDEMLAKARSNAAALGARQVEFRKGYAEDLPVPSGWADAVLSNGVINLCEDKRVVLDEVWRVLRPGGFLQFADIAHARPIPGDAQRDIDLRAG